MPLVRVVIPTYNRAALVAEALESVLAQTFSDFEVVVADDGSTDDTQKLLQHFSARDSRVRSLALSHGGAAAARNAAIGEPGQHRYVAFLDSDDLWVPYHLERAVESLECERSVSLFFGGSKIRAVAGSRAESRTQEPVPMGNPVKWATRTLGYDFYLLEDVNCVQAILRSEVAPKPTTVVVRREAVKRTEWFDINLEIFEDLEFFLYLAVDGCNFAYHDVTHCLMRRFSDNLTGSTDLSSPVVRRRYQSVANYHKTTLAVCKRADERKIVSRALSNAFFIIGECSREQSDLKGARAAYSESVRYHCSSNALRGLLLSLLPYPIYSLLRNVITSLRAAIPL